MTQSKLAINIWTNPIYFLAFGFGSGLLPIAPGTWGTLAAIPLYLLIQNLSLVDYSIILIIASLLGIWWCDVTERAIGIHDYSGIVWDEICGYGVTMLAVPHHWYWIIAGFFLFRLFDIWKPWPISWFNNNVPGGLGVMVDDLVAGVAAWIVMQILILVLRFS